MALYDWNHNGTKNIANSGGISIFGAILALILGLLSAAGLIAFLGGGNDLFVILTILLWLICSRVLSVWFHINGL